MGVAVMTSWCGRCRLAAALVAQCQPLMHPETMLFIDNNQPEACELDFRLEQGMRTHGHLARTAADGLQRSVTRLAPRLARVPDNRDTERLQPGPETAVMLLGQQFRRRHQGDLVPGLHRDQGCACRHDCLAGTDIPLHQPRHRVPAGQVMPQFPDNACLRSGHCKRQRINKLLKQRLPATEYRRRQGLQPLPHPAQAEVMCKQFFIGEPLLRGMITLRQQFHRGTGWRPVHITQCCRQGGQFPGSYQFGGQPVNQSAVCPPVHPGTAAPAPQGRAG